MSVPVHDCGCGHARHRVGSFEVSEAHVRPRHSGWHAHPHATIAVVLDGDQRKHYRARTTEASQGTVVVTPAEELHQDTFGRDGTALVLVECGYGFEAAASFVDWNAFLIARRIERELNLDDAFSRLALEGLALELAALAGRGPVARVATGPAREAYELLHERFRETPTVREVARHVGLNPSHLARSFRETYRESIGECVRRLRVEWAAAKLVSSDVPLARLAVEAGFVDQSHFTRAFKGRFGITPARFRTAYR
ncbi:MAG TPA: AraC family transcriptional regulator [Gaiellaceae bacterium]|nr:AraC family transcriptional regulator [Gaiellaceae bacterium]